jgi:surface protein
MNGPFSSDSLRAALNRDRDKIERNEISIVDWDVSNVTNMRGLFQGWSEFNQPIGNWDTSNVEDMSNMFQQCTSFNQPLAWNTLKVENMAFMFASCSSFNSPLGSALLIWSFAPRVMGMFSLCKSFNQDLDSADTSRVVEMRAFFHGCSAFNGRVYTWITSNVLCMRATFSGCSSFNQPIGDWDTSNVTDMSLMLVRCTNFNQPIRWNTGNVRDMTETFSGCSSFNQTLRFDMSNVTDKDGMLEGTRATLVELGTNVHADTAFLADVASRDEQTGQRAFSYPECVVCLTNVPRLAPPCGHLCLCGTCAQTLVRQAEPAPAKCPTCKSPFGVADLRETYAFGSALARYYAKKANGHANLARTKGGLHEARAHYYTRKAQSS